MLLWGHVRICDFVWKRLFKVLDRCATTVFNSFLFKSVYTQCRTEILDPFPIDGWGVHEKPLGLLLGSSWRSKHLWGPTSMIKCPKGTGSRLQCCLITWKLWRWGLLVLCFASVSCMKKSSCKNLIGVLDLFWHEEHYILVLIVTKSCKEMKNFILFHGILFWSVPNLWPSYVVNDLCLLTNL